MIEEDVTIARWGFAAMLVFASLLTAAFLCWLHEHGIRLSEPILKFLRRPIGEVLIVLVCVGGLVQHGATKGFFGGPRMMAPREMQTELASAPESVESVAGMFPSYTNAVTNVCATGIMPAETSVFLRAHWPWNIYPAPTGVEVYAAPQLSTNAWVGVGTAPIPNGDNSAVIELPYSVLPDGWTSSMFFMLGLNVDTDQDGLSDSFERIVSKTDPNLADTDGDGMPDGWEYNNGLNPLSDPTDDEASADADSDGISNIAEMGYGTDPQKRDSDGDGIDDLGELGSVRQLDDFVWYDTSGGVNILASEVDSSIDDKVWTVDLHYPAVIGGKVYDRLTVDSNALVYLIPSNGMAVAQSKYSYSILPADTLAQTNIAVAVNWRDMNLNRQNGSQVRVAHVASNNCTVVEFVNLERRSYPSDKMTAQVVVPGGRNGTILVNYLSLTENLDGRSATVGLMDSTSRAYANAAKFYALQWSYSQSGVIAPSMTLAYRVGTGTNPNEKDTDGDGLYDDEEIFVTKTDPCLFDTDGDGLSDGDEIERQTNPLFVDTDEDGMPDGWEVKYGLDPLSDDALGDLDEDGLPNVCEYNLHTKVGTPDTDGDGLSDGSEAAWIDTHATIPWFNTSGGTVLLSFANTDKALFTVELPTAITLCGEAVTHALVDVNGIVHFGRTSTTSGVDSVDGVGDLGNDRNFQTVVVAPFSADLYARSALQSKITVKALTNAGTQYAVFDFARIGTYSGSANEISFQVSVPLNCESNVVYVRYGDVVNASSYNISIGAQGSWNFPKLKYWYGQSPNVTNGMVMAYHFGCGSDPLLRDSDDDGLEDYLEFELGTNPHYEDSDLDGLDDEWETTYNLNPLSGEGDDGSDGDPDGDGLSNAREYEYDTNPVSPFTDADLIPDGMEVGYITTNAPLPWLVFDSYEDLTTLISTNNRRCVNCATPLPLWIQGENVTNLTISANGIVFFNRAGYANPGNTTSAERFTYDVDEDALVLAPYLQYAYIRSDIPDRQTSIRYGVATHEGAGYLLIEYLNSYYNTSTRPTNSISFQLAVPTNCPDRAYARYKDVLGTYMNGKNASIGMQSFDGRWMQSWCYHEDNRISDDMSLEFVFGTNSDPCSEDSDNDGLDDDEELQHGTNLGDNDSDADGMPDGWEVQYDFNPCVASDADGDADNDGVDNLTESLLGSNPRSEDTDGDGLTDDEEIEEGTSLTSVDTDCDGLEDGFELTIGTNPLQPDTDGDGMDDGWEWAYCRRARMPRLLAEGGRSTPDFDPAVNNNTDTDPDNDFGADPDGDGLSNGEECENRTDPTSPDTDGDGVTDGNEAGQGSDPSDATDGGRPNSRIAVRFTFGDPSGSHSEKYRLEITPVSGQGERPASFSWLNANYGECETRTARLKAGWKYEVRLTWAACNHASDGSYYPNYDYTLSMGQDIPLSVVLDDPGSIFRSDYYGGEYYGASHFPVLDSVATITVYEVTKVTVCKPDDQSWEELEDSRVVLDDEELRIKVEIAPQVKSLAQCRQMFGDVLIVKTSGTCPSGVSVPIGDDATMNNSAGKGEIRITKTRQQLISLGLLPARNEDGVNEMACLDMGDDNPTNDSNLSDSQAFLELGQEFRGNANSDIANGLERTPPISKPSESFFKAAGAEIVSVSYAGVQAAKRQVMNQADVFYYSGHGDFASGALQSKMSPVVYGFTPSVVANRWAGDLNCAVFAGCSVLNIGDFRAESFVNVRTRIKYWFRKQQSNNGGSPGLIWEGAGPDYLLGYCWTAPLDNQGAAQVAQTFVMEMNSGRNPVDAWRNANDRNACRNACAIDCSQIPHKFWYWSETSGTAVWTNKIKGVSSW